MLREAVFVLVPIDDDDWRRRRRGQGCEPVRVDGGDGRSQVGDDRRKRAAKSMERVEKR